jgi:guanylate kinase
MASEKQIVVISGPTGSGESTITNALLARLPNTRRMITATSRPRRSEEGPNDYYFFSKEEFLEKAAKGEILEVNYQESRDTYYGAYAPEVEAKLAEGRVILVNCDIVGTKYYKQNYNAIAIFIVPGSIEELVNRIKKRNPEMSETELEKRREYAEREWREEQPFYDYVVTNEDGKLEEAIENTIAILKKEGYSLGA